MVAVGLILGTEDNPRRIPAGSRPNKGIFRKGKIPYPGWGKESGQEYPYYTVLSF